MCYNYNSDWYITIRIRPKRQQATRLLSFVLPKVRTL
nr:MAG TPA: hypothetical protein [Caudoviricetes sp.]